MFDRKIRVQNFANISFKEIKEFYTRYAKKRSAAYRDESTQPTIGTFTRAKLTDFCSFTDKIYNYAAIVLHEKKEADEEEEEETSRQIEIHKCFLPLPQYPKWREHTHTHGVSLCGGECWASERASECLYCLA